MEISGSGQFTAALADAGARGSTLFLVSSNSPTPGEGGAIAFGSTQSKAANSIGFAGIKGLLTNGINNTIGDLAFSTRNAPTDTALTERIRILSSGNVGIGTTSPQKKLHINQSGLLISGGTAEETAPYSTRLIVDSGASTAHPLMDLRNDNGSVFYVSGSRVGIGTTNPLAAAHVQSSRNSFTDVLGSLSGNPADYQLYLRTPSNLANGGSGLAFSVSSSSSNVGAAISFERVGSEALGKLHFATKQGSVYGAAPISVMTLSENGNVGIGTTSPSAKLHVLGDAKFDDGSGQMSSTTFTNFPATYNFSNGSAADGVIGIFGGAGFTGTTMTLGQEQNPSSNWNHLQLIADTNGSPITQFVVRGDGNVGIVTSIYPI